jgi:hypothetical protein
VHLCVAERPAFEGRFTSYEKSEEREARSIDSGGGYVLALSRTGAFLFARCIGPLLLLQPAAMPVPSLMR